MGAARLGSAHSTARGRALPAPAAGPKQGVRWDGLPAALGGRGGGSAGGGQRKSGGNVSSVLGNAAAGRRAEGPQGRAPALSTCRASSPAPHASLPAPTARFAVGTSGLCRPEGPHWCEALTGLSSPFPMGPGATLHSRGGVGPAASAKLLQHRPSSSSVLPWNTRAASLTSHLQRDEERQSLPCSAGTGRREVFFLPPGPELVVPMAQRQGEFNRIG